MGPDLVTSTLKKWRGRAGDVFAIEVAPKMFAFGQVSSTKDLAFFDVKADAPLEVEVVLRAPVLFRIPMARGGTKGRPWFHLGNRPPAGQLSVHATYRVQSVGSNQIFLMNGDNTSGSQVEISKEEAKHYEPMAWWFCEHIEERLLDWYLNRPSRIVESVHRVHEYDSNGQAVHPPAVQPFAAR